MLASPTKRCPSVQLNVTNAPTAYRRWLADPLVPSIRPFIGTSGWGHCTATIQTNLWKPRKNWANCLPLHRGTGPLHTPFGSHSSPGGPLKRYPHEHLNTARPQADVFNSVKLRCGSSKKSGGHWTGWQLGGGDDQFPVNVFNFKWKGNLRFVVSPLIVTRCKTGWVRCSLDNVTQRTCIKSSMSELKSFQSKGKRWNCVWLLRTRWC